VLGLGFDDLGAGVARAWGLPDTLQRALRIPDGEVPTRAISARADAGVERMRWLARSANALTDAMLGADGDQQTAALESVAQTYAAALALQPRDIVAGALQARTRVANLAQAMGLHIAPGAAAQRLLQATARTGAGPGAVHPLGSAGPSARPAGAELDQPTVVNNPEATAAQAQLSQGLQALKQALAQGSLRLNEVLNLALQTLQVALSLRCVVFCLRDPKSGLLMGRVALGSGPADVASAFRIAPDGSARQDLFAAICAKGADLLIADSQAVASRLPTWYRQRVNAATFLLLPMMVKGQAIGLLYADKAEAGTLKVGEAELALLRSLRDQVVSAFSKGSA
jgi:eukaryotic-like serine/threonine-protein kinase